jgi:hypothetical protein
MRSNLRLRVWVILLVALAWSALILDMFLRTEPAADLMIGLLVVVVLLVGGGFAYTRRLTDRKKDHSNYDHFANRHPILVFVLPFMVLAVLSGLIFGNEDLPFYVLGMAVGLLVALMALATLRGRWAIRFPVKRLQISREEIRVRTMMGGTARYEKDQVAAVLHGNYFHSTGEQTTDKSRWFRLELVDGTLAPIEWIAPDSSTSDYLQFLDESGWPTKSH